MQKKTIVSLLNSSIYRSVDSLISHFQKKRQTKKYFYRPIGIEVEITNCCNLRCGGCHLMIDEIDKPKDILSGNDFIKVLKDCAKCGMFGYSITGGEPFLKFRTILHLLRAGHGLDLYKLNTNGTYFRTKEITWEYLSQLKANGFGTKNKFIKPVLVISLGHQNLAGVPIQNAVNLTSLFYEIFDPDKVLCAINLTDANLSLTQKIFTDFMTLYKKTAGKQFDEDLFMVRFFSLTNVSTLTRLGLLHGPKVKLADKIIDFQKEYLSGGCFNIHIQNIKESDKAETLIPRCVLRPNGDVYACPGFNRVHKIGNVLKDSIEDIMRRTNDNLILRTIFTDNLKGLYSMVLKKNKEIQNIKIEKQYGPCDVCQLLTKSIIH